MIFFSCEKCSCLIKNAVLAFKTHHRLLLGKDFLLILISHHQQLYTYLLRDFECIQVRNVIAYTVMLTVHIREFCQVSPDPLPRSRVGLGTRLSRYYFTTDCLPHTTQMVVVETIWQLHTRIVMNSCIFGSALCMCMYMIADVIIVEACTCTCT